MIDGNNTSPEWQQHRTDLLVLPIGAMEQHGPHLPLNTDTTLAEYTAKIVAEHFDAALLPALPIGNSFEHSGFRGTFSLRPETLMQIIRDLTDEAETQGFKILLIINGHGGNFSLGPVIRDINRSNRPLKILLYQVLSQADSSCLEAIHQGRLDIHAGEAETSFFTAITGLQVDTPLGGGNKGNLSPNDLNTFGIGFLNHLGIAGHAELASMEKGQKLLDSARKPMLEYLEERIRLLRRHPHYSGTGGMSIRDLSLCDLPDVMALSQQENWNQTDAEWRLFMEQGHALSMVHQGKIVGTAAGIGWNERLAWIGLVITATEMRGNGISTRLLEELLQRYRTYRTIKLDASVSGIPIYEKLGFKAEKKIIRFSACPSGEKPDDTVLVSSQACIFGKIAKILVFDSDSTSTPVASYRSDLAEPKQTRKIATACGKHLSGVFSPGSLGRCPHRPLPPQKKSPRQSCLFCRKYRLDWTLVWKVPCLEDLPAIAEHESTFTGTNRLPLFHYFLEHWPEMAISAYRNNKLVGYSFGRSGRVFRQVGVLGADSTETALAILRKWIALDPATPLQIDIPETQTEFIGKILESGFRKERDFVRMYYGAPCGNWNVRHLYAIFGPEIG